jgi:hypothetical protein
VSDQVRKRLGDGHDAEQRMARGLRGCLTPACSPLLRGAHATLIQSPYESDLQGNRGVGGARLEPVDSFVAGLGDVAMGTSVRMIERHYGALLDGAGADIAEALDALDAGRDRYTQQDART